MLFVVREQPLLIGGKAKEVALLLDPFHRRSLRAAAHAIRPKLGLAFAVIGLVADRVPAGISVLVDVASSRHAPPDFLARPVVTLLRGADEVVVGAIQRLHHLLEAGRIAVGESPRGKAGA